MAGRKTKTSKGLQGKTRRRVGKSGPIRVGVVGIGRGMCFADGANERVGMKLVAVCEQSIDALKRLNGQFRDVMVYTDYDKFLAHDMDAVVLANFFHQHAPFAVKALDAGYHVMSETSACKTLGEAVALVRAVEKSGRIYCFAENCCYRVTIQEMRRLYQQGEIGDLRMAVGEYIHPIHHMNADGILARSRGLNHWRNWIPSTYYCTHALGPVMYVTDLMPVSVNAHSIDWSKGETERPPVRRGDPGSVILCRMSNGAIATINGQILRGHGLWHRFHGSRGLMESLRSSNREIRSRIRVQHEPWDRKPNVPVERIYEPDFPEHADIAARAGHGGGDFFTIYHFAQAIRTQRQPWLDVHRGVAMSVVGIQAWKSCLDEGRPYEIPDFTKESVRRRYQDENWSPFPEDAGPGQPPPSITGMREPTRAQIAAAEKVWREIGKA